MTDKKEERQALDEASRDVLDMLQLTGRHTGHSLTRVGDWWLCSCHKEVQRVA